MQIKPNSNIAPHIAMGVLKGFLSRPYKICTEKHLQSEIDFLIDIYTKNGHNRTKLTNTATEYLQSINQKATIRRTPRTLKTSENYLGPQSLALNFEKNFKRKILKPYSHQELI